MPKNAPDLTRYLRPEETAQVLSLLLKRNKNLRAEVNEIVITLFEDADATGISEDVVELVTGIGMEELGNRSGRQFGGYVEPSQAAWDLHEEALKAIRDDMVRKYTVGLIPAAETTCQGIILGLYELDGTDQGLLAWAVEFPTEAAYQNIKKMLQHNQRELHQAEKQRELLKEEAALATADKAASENPVHLIHDLKSAIGRELATIAEKLEAEAEKYSQLKSAIELKQQELERIYEIETAATDLTALLEAHHQAKDKFEAEMKNTQEAFAVEMAAVTLEREKQEKDAVSKWREEERLRAQSRKREEEEYQYNLTRERDQKRNALEDELGALEKEISSNRVEFDRETGDKQNELAERAKVLLEKEKHLDDLQNRVDSIPAEIEKSTTAAVKDTTEKLTTLHEAQKALLKKSFEGEINVLSSKIETMDKLVETQSRQIEALTRQQETAYEKVQDIASKAVAGAQTSLFSLTQRHGRSNRHEGAELDKEL